jgi:type II secretory pathway component PulK
MNSFRLMAARSKHQRRGAVLVAALVALLIVMSLLGTMLLAAVQARRQLHAERNMRQCDLLLHAGLDRAAAQLARNPAYTGETWRPSDSVLAGGNARVVIEVKNAASDQHQRLAITAEFPLGDEWSIRRSFTGIYKTSSLSPEEN